MAMAERSEGSSGLILGLDIGGTKTTVLIGSDRAEIFYRRRFKTHPERGFEITFRNICRSVEEVLREARRLGKMPESISVSIGGPLDVKEGIIFSPPNLPGWDKIPLKGLLQQRFGLPVYLEHDGNAGALAEYFFGAGQGFRNIIF
ncbi:MAG TPA: ROK family protein, partial [Candidatus Latescibacteria bacterium]|nr:ROK family protein [Candidatus Latescibacterota bacterium]